MFTCGSRRPWRTLQYSSGQVPGYRGEHSTVPLWSLKQENCEWIHKYFLRVNLWNSYFCQFLEL